MRTLDWVVCAINYRFITRVRIEFCIFTIWSKHLQAGIVLFYWSSETDGGMKVESEIYPEVIFWNLEFKHIPYIYVWTMFWMSILMSKPCQYARMCECLSNRKCFLNWQVNRIASASWLVVHDNCFFLLFRASENWFIWFIDSSENMRRCSSIIIVWCKITDTIFNVL